MLGDLDDWQQYVDDLVVAGKLDRSPDGSLANSRAMSEAEKAFDLWKKKSSGGRKGAAKTNSPDRSGVESADGSVDRTPEKKSGSPDAEPEPELDSTFTNVKGDSSPEKILFDAGRKVLGRGSGGLITKLRKLKGTDDAFRVIQEAAGKSNPTEWIVGVLKAGDREYSDQQQLMKDAIREAQV